MIDPSPARRADTKRMIARQIAIADGYVWQSHPNAQQMRKHQTYLTLAENILATVERCMTKWSWQ